MPGCDRDTRDPATAGSLCPQHAPDWDADSGDDTDTADDAETPASEAAAAAFADATGFFHGRLDGGRLSPPRSAGRLTPAPD